MDSSSVGEGLPANVKKTEILFQHLFLRILEMGGRCGVIVPDGVLFGSSNAHVAIRKKLIDAHKATPVSFAFNNQCHRSIVDELDLHHRTKAARRRGDAQGSHRQ